MKRTVFLFLFCFSLITQAQPPDKPKLIIGIVVDQMRPDYLYTYFLNNIYQQNNPIGFLRMAHDGTVFTNIKLYYMPTYTAPGHAAIFTGKSAIVHGIIANNWYDRTMGKMIYCVDDDRYEGVGGKKGSNKRSPHLLMAPTFGDMMKDSNNKAKVIGIALKDRAAIIPAGKKGDAAYWLDGTTGEWVTSTYYTDKMPEWVKQFNKQKLIKKYLKSTWELLYPSTVYKSKLPDNNPYEGLFVGEKNPVFPHKIKALRRRNGHYNLIRSTPYGNELTAEFAKAAILNEGLGQDEVMDLLTVSFSSTDYIGHQYGPQSLELEDTYYRLNRVLEDLILFLNKQIGKDNYLLFLTSDHGVQDNPIYAKEQLKKDAGYLNIDSITTALKDTLELIYGSPSIIEANCNYQYYLNDKEIERLGANADSVKQTIKYYLEGQEGIRKVYTETVITGGFSIDLAYAIRSGVYKGRSGDVYYVLKEGWLEDEGYGRTGTSHGSIYRKDITIPLILYGWKVQPRETYTNPIDIKQLVPALASIIGMDIYEGIYYENLIKESLYPVKRR